MKVDINGKKIEVKAKAKVIDVLAAVSINPETVLVKRKGTLIPHDEPLKDKDSLELINVISGG